jgi:hypothetical protein
MKNHSVTGIHSSESFRLSGRQVCKKTSLTNKISSRVEFMEIIPAIDIIEGKCVRAFEGKF